MDRNQELGNRNHSKVCDVETGWTQGPLGYRLASEELHLGSEVSSG